MLRTIMIGLGKRTIEDHLPTLSSNIHFELVGVNDLDAATMERFSAEYSVYGDIDLARVIDVCKPDVAIVAIPHKAYLPIIEQLAAKKIHIIKEKPLAVSLEEAVKMQELARVHEVLIGVIVQRRFSPVHKACLQLMRHIGKIYSIEGKYTLNIAQLDEGWRASKQMAGGALIDMGYHLIDLLIWYFGLPDTITAKLSTGNRENQIYYTEDTAHLLFDYSFDRIYENKAVGHVVISRAYPKKEESLLVLGSKGSVKLERDRVYRTDIKGKMLEVWQQTNGQPSAINDQLEYFADEINSKNYRNSAGLHHHLQHLAIIQAAYDSDASGSSIDPSIYLNQIKENKK